MKTENKYNKIVNFDKEKNEITVLGSTFIYSDNFKGANGTTFDIISQSEYKERMLKQNVIENLIDSNIELPEEFKRTDFNGLYKAMKQNDELESFVFDTSYNELWEQMRTELKLSKNDAFIFNCSGCGRCFDKDFQGNVNPKLSIIIREFES